MKLQINGDAGYRPIERPPALATATAQSSDAVRHALEITQAAADWILENKITKPSFGAISEFRFRAARVDDPRRRNRPGD